MPGPKNPKQSPRANPNDSQPGPQTATHPAAQNETSHGVPWSRTITPSQWRILIATHLGWCLDGFDIMLYAFALLHIKSQFNLTPAQAGAVASSTLFASAFGGMIAGYLSDRWGRLKILIYSILIYSVFTGLTATSHSLFQLLVWRTIVGLGLGAEWSAGSVLVAESWPAAHRGKAMGFVQAGWAVGTIAAALLSAWILPRWGWRWLFIAGTLPAFLTYWIRKKTPESEIWRETRKSSSSQNSSVSVRALLEPAVFKRVILAVCLTSTLLFAYWGFFTWIPSYLALPVSLGGAGMGLVKSMGWILPMQVGAFIGYTSFGFFSDRWGRKPSFLFFVLGAAICVPIFGYGARHPFFLLILSPLLGFFGHGYFSLFGAFLSELFESPHRGTAQGLCYNSGRAASAAAPMIIGYLAHLWGLGAALSVTSLFFLLGAVLILPFPETKGEIL